MDDFKLTMLLLYGNKAPRSRNIAATKFRRHNKRQLLVSIINEVFLYPRNILLSKLNLSWFNDNKNWFDRVSVLINLLFKLIIIEACNQ